MSRWWRWRAEPAASKPSTESPDTEATARALLDRQAAPEAITIIDAGGSTARPCSAEGWFLHGRALRQLAQHEAALASFDTAIALDPAHVAAHEARGNALMSLGRTAEALVAYESALALQANRNDARYNRGLALLNLRRAADALNGFDDLLRDLPDDADVHTGRGNALLDLRHLDEAVRSYRRALALLPDHPPTLHNLGLVLQALRSPDLAAEAFDRLGQVAPGSLQVEGKLLHARMLACDWRDQAALLDRVEAGLRRGEAVTDPFSYQGVSMRPDLQHVCARLASATNAQPSRIHLCHGHRLGSGRLRVGYVSGEFREQATSLLAVELFELHDRSRFEIVAFDNGWDDGSVLRRRLVKAFDTVVDIAQLSDHAAACAVRKREIDILVDLNGFFGLARPGLFGWRPSPIQVNYLGFPGTLGADWIDYIIADRRLIPAADEVHYTEKVVCLPCTYQPNDSRRVAPAGSIDRASAGLPDVGFVFCCFNNTYKITPQVFDVWMSLLRQLPGSVLWLLGDNAAAQRNLRAEAGRRQVDPTRLVFAPRIAPADHLARHALADLFLDTLPCNAHTTASDALGAGLPVLTCCGTTFSGRVATSLLHALGLHDLVTADLAAYEQRALALARDPKALGVLRKRLDRDCSVQARSVFGAAGLRVELEKAYERMAQRLQQGLPPVSFEV